VPEAIGKLKITSKTRARFIRWSSAHAYGSVMASKPDKDQYEAWARRARAQADDATTEMACSLHVSIAEDYEAKAAQAVAERAHS
jgi:hypothetical protein